MKNTLILIALLLSLKSSSQNYDFTNSMDREKLELYLGRAITMQGLMDANTCYFPPCTVDPFTYYPIGYNEDIQMLAKINARFIGRATGMWAGEWVVNYGFFNYVSSMVNDITLAYQNSNLVKPIIQAGMFEIVSKDVNGIQFSSEVANTYGESVRYFNFDNMKYSNFPNNQPYKTSYSSDLIVPDISKKETQMWFYYLATRYIDNGIEALHFGQVEIMDNEDPNHIHYWDLLSKIRKYAKLKNRGLVLCDGHTKGLYYYNDSKQLLFDFHSYPLRIQEVNSSWGGNNGGIAKLDYNYCDAIYGNSKGGKTYFGWECASLPFLVEYDNYGYCCDDNNDGTISPNEDKTNQFNNGNCFTWGWDECTWFGKQDEPYRNEWLTYAHYKVKCLDKNGFAQMLGRRGLTESNVSSPGKTYRASNGTSGYQYNQQDRINDTWNGVYDNYNWVHHDFTSEEVTNQPNPAIVKSNIVFSGSDRMYYIGTDYRVHGYIKNNGIWMTVSPSWSAHFNGQNINSQVLASSNLIMSPDNSTLYYIGIDGLIYRYTLDNPTNLWTSYTYSAMPSNSSMQNQNLIAVNSLTCVDNDKIFYIAKEVANNNKRRVHGFVYYGGTWVTTSPSWGAHANGYNINSQIEVQDYLCISPDHSKIYYIGTNGFIYYYTLNTPGNVWTTYNYTSMPSNSAMLNQNIRGVGNIICPDNDIIYYQAKELSNNNAVRVHGLVNYSNNWVTVSPSWSANSNGTPIGIQEQALANLNISPNKNIITYYGADNQMHGFKVNNMWSYNYFNFPTNSSLVFPVLSSTFKNDNEIYYTSHSDKKIHEFKFEIDNCNNKSIEQIEKVIGYKNEQNIDRLNKTNKTMDNNPKITIFPNPASTQLLIKIENTYTSVGLIISDNIGKIITTQSLNFQDNIILNTSNFTNGLYHLKIVLDGITISNHKFLIQQ
jgi:hypothetical protein